jgi:Leucine-rich repeat (LRR) protein
MNFSDILKIDNMWNFVLLTKLQMDNNIIEKIEGLEKLVNLEWLGNTGIKRFYDFTHKFSIISKLKKYHGVHT